MRNMEKTIKGGCGSDVAEEAHGSALGGGGMSKVFRVLGRM